MHYRSIWMMVCLMSYSMAFQAADHESDELDLEDQLLHAVDRNNKAKILGCMKQNPGLLFSLIDDEGLLDKPDEIIRIFTTMKKAGVNLNYQDEDGDGILHAVIEASIADIFTVPIIIALITNIAGQTQDSNDQEGVFLSDSELVIKLKNAQKIVKALLKLGVKKKMKTHEDHETAADRIKDIIDEIGDEEVDYKQSMHELHKLYKMLK